MKERHGVQLLAYGPNKDGWVKDDGVSGSLLEGRAFSKLISDLEAGKIRFDYLITYSMSRLARHDKTSKDMSKLVKSATDKARIMAVLNGAGVEVLDGDGINDPASVITEIKETLSGEEYRMIRRRTLDGKRRVLGEGRWAVGGRPPYGYKPVPGDGRDKRATLVPCEVDGPRFLQLMRWFCEGGLKFATRKAQAQGWPAPRGGATWHAPSVQHMVNHLEPYLGEFTVTVDGQPFTLKYPPLLDSRTYAAIVRRRNETTISKRTAVLSTGFLDCACGVHMNGHRASPKGRFHISCRNRCGAIADDMFAPQLWTMVVLRLLQIQAHGLKPKKNEAGELDAAKQALAKVQEKLTRLVKLYTDGNIDDAAYTETNDALRGEKLAAQREIDRLAHVHLEAKQKLEGHSGLKDKATETLNQIRLMKNQDNLEVQRRILSDLLQGERVTLTWHGATSKRVKGKRQKRDARYATLTLPAFGDLPPITMRADRDVTRQAQDLGIPESILTRMRLIRFAESKRVAAQPKETREAITNALEELSESLAKE